MNLLSRILGRNKAAPIGASTVPPRARAGYLRDTRSKIFSTRQTSLRDHRDDVRIAWRRTAALAMDLIQNSGRLRGAADQVIADTVGVELVLNPQPDLEDLGYSPEETAQLVRTIKRRWKRWAWSPQECDARGKFTVPQMIDIALRHDMAYGEALFNIDYMRPSERKRYGIASGTKLCMVNPTKLVQDTSVIEGLFQGVIHDPSGRPIAYRIEEKESGISRKRDYRARDVDGRQLIVHVFDPMDCDDVRGISRLAAAFREHIQQEVLVDTTIQTAILQTVFAATLTSKSPSKEAFEAITQIIDDIPAAPGSDQPLSYATEMRDYFMAQLERAAESEIAIGSDPQVSHLAPDEELKLLSAQTPGPQFLPVDDRLSRTMARAIGITFGGMTMNYEGATYSSTRMENSSIWPVVTRRRERIAAPPSQAAYESWFDEEVGEGRIVVKGGYDLFRENRDRFCWALWQGPAKPTADDGKSAKAASERLWNGSSTLADECAELGKDADEVFEQRRREHRLYVAEGMPSPFERARGASAAKDDTADDVADAPRVRKSENA
ncbi:phage portal protein [Rhodopseudomonas sp. HC1]|uniref:phage portal protein n=1 Tax=Rhodopseudomonas infernalis TaxID=2897386 RepID=UPI001EE91696|nr:phage portal protein [Rhodopseudomonas infernalis]MCG6204188.1 phage portal protein [Rhodopseudomonas infernalis]